MARNEELLNALLNDEETDSEPISRAERYLKACCEKCGCEWLPEPLTRNEELLYELAEKIAQGGGDITVESLNVSENGTYTAPSGKAYTPVVVSVQKGVPIDVSTAEGMTAVLIEANVGKAYRFTGTTDDTYTNGDIYVVEGNEE